MEKAYRGIIWFFLALLVLVLLGFYKPYFALFPDFDKTFNTIVHIHATALLLWVGLLLVQPVLILTKKMKAHRFLGKCTYFLVPVIVLSSIAVMDKQYGEEKAQGLGSSESLKTLWIPFMEILLFSVFYLLAILYKRDARYHMRYIVCTAL